MKILETERLLLREITSNDAEFILDLLNQPSFIQFIGDRGVRTIEHALEYIESRFTKSYKDNGFGLYAVELNGTSAYVPEIDDKVRVAGSDGSVPIGLCGFVKRDTLPEPDIGFAFLPRYGGKGYAVEAARGVMKYGRDQLGLSRVLAITTLDNAASGRLLQKIGFAFDREIDIGDEVLKLYSCQI